MKHVNMKPSSSNRNIKITRVTPLFFCVVVFFSLFLLSSCGQDSTETESASPSLGEAAEEARDIENGVERVFGIDTKTIPLAKVNGKIITNKELREKHIFYGSAVPEELFLNDVLIPETLLLQEAEEQEVEVSRKEIAKIRELLVAQRGLSEDDFFEALEEKGLKKRTVKKFIEEQALITKLLSTIILDEGITQEEALDFYLKSSKDIKDETGKLLSFEESKESIGIMLLNVKRELATRKYVAQLAGAGTVLLYK